MAKRKKRKYRKSARKYIALFSDCGGVEQFGIVNDESGGLYVHNSVDGAKTAIDCYIESNLGGEFGGSKFAVAELVDVGRTSGMEWAGKAEID